MKRAERSAFQRELKILHAKKTSGINFTTMDAERLSYLEKQLIDEGEQFNTRARTSKRSPTPSDDRSVLDVSAEEYLNPNKTDNQPFDPLSEFGVEPASGTLEDPNFPILLSSVVESNDEPNILDLPDPVSGEKDGQELLQDLFDPHAVGSIDTNGTVLKATPPPLPVKPPPLTTACPSEENDEDRPPSSPTPLGKLRTVSRPNTAEKSTRSVRSEPESPLDNQFKGPRKVIVHFLDGVCRRGTLNQSDITSGFIKLDAQPNEPPGVQEVSTDVLKAIFLLLPRGAQYPQKIGKHVRVVLIDGRTLVGTSPDYDVNGKAFTLLPHENRGNIERVIVYCRGTKRVQIIDD